MPTVSQHYNLTTGDVSALASDDSMRAAAPVVLMVSGGADSTSWLRPHRAGEAARAAR